ncbi:6062_t:CDS:2 [Cetraspora pellucida]|uniref:6062_t:CDS:1 n=1 Tax=Cetraspora pellucida TaxID=1433469 RepID=A0ACA9MDL2_9GLOM|nr:6062_t:CDS:2 [Cetraspora pellucida]
MVSEVVVTHRDRLCRFAYELIEYIFSLHSTKLMVLFNESNSDEHELSQDILAINTVFICRMQGRRAARYRKERKKKKDDNCSKNKETKTRDELEQNIVDQDRCFFNTNKQKEWIKPQMLKDKLELYLDIEDEKFRKTCMWDESIDEALTARTNIIQNNLKDVKKSSLSFKSKKDLRQTMSKQARIRETQDVIHAVSIDPGVRTPFTWYSPTKGAGKIGNRDIGRIYRLCKYMDDLISRKDKLSNSKSKRKKKKASRLDKAVHRMRRKIYRLQNEIHRKTIKFLTDEFDIIVIPPFETSNMINRKTRKINKKTVKRMLGWSHYKFKQRLISKSKEKGNKVIFQNEAYTSKTCSWCGNMQNISGSKIYKCKNCNIEIDRDVNGARGILLRALLDGAMILS